MAEGGETLKDLLDACCSQQYCTCKEKPGAPCGKDGNTLEVTVEFVSEPEDNGETTDTNDADDSGVVETNLGSEKCSTPQQICCICGKPIRPSSQPVEETVVIESPEPAGCGLEDCDTEFCTAQDLPCENMEEPAIAEDDPADTADALEEKHPSEIETSEVPEPEEGSERKSESSNPEPTENETGPTDELPEGAKKSCPCKGGSKDPPPEE